MTRHLAEQYAYALGRRPADGEVRAWDRSLPVLADDLRDAGLADVEVLVEYQLPLSSKRVDVLLAGTHPHTGRPSYVLVELKQWSNAEPVEDADDLCYVDAYGRHPVLHPGEQVRRYCAFLADFSRALEDESDAIAGAAYLHNATEFGVSGLRSLPEDAFGRLFTRERRGEFHEFLRARLAPSSGAGMADILLSSAVAPSRQLLKVAATEVQTREQFTLLDQQQVAYRLVLTAVERARAANAKQVILVTGGPGSGKSVIALSVLGEAWRRGWSALHATGSKSFTETLRKVAGARSTRVKALFKYFNSFMTADPNGLDLLICDEAHRVRETSANRYTRAELRTGRPQVAELIDAARVPVFLLDEHQVVRPGETGTPELIRSVAGGLGIQVVEVSLDAQFRCGGSRTYEEWVLRLLGLDEGGPIAWEGDTYFEVRVADSPQELEGLLRLKASEEYGARITAGFCWPWSDPRSDGSLVDDVVIGSWSRPWNVKGDRAVGGAPPASLWATDPAGFGQVGCIYTAQGFEYDWNGVIMGADLVWRDDRWVVQRSASKDPGLRGVADEDADRLLRNVYKVLLTRGMVGTVIHSVDPETQKFLASLLVAQTSGQGSACRTDARR
ncbi:MAG TPA: DUF2075 domain-containing protein [Mycobacteriales bacterium]|nr:DUF2075 domain-containing protein [Mycobacteriales bacterium]